MDDKRIPYFPFHAINEYMVPEFRLKVLTAVLRDLDKLPGERRASLNNMVKRNVTVPGFRNSAAAPLAVRVRGSVSTFEHRADFAAQILQGWAELHAELRDQVYAVLQTRSFEGVLPAEADRSKLPGFQTTWPMTETYEALDEAYFAANPGVQVSTDDIRLMFVWLVNRLPYDLFEEDGEEEEKA